jgi:hypothetical protein
MENEMLNFLSQAKLRGLCTNYTKKWESAESKKELLDIALDANGMPYVCKCVAEGWGITPEYIAQSFKGYLNGRYIHSGNGYTSAIYVGDGNVGIVSTAAILIDCKGVVSSNRMCELYIANSDVELIGAGTFKVHTYNSRVHFECDVKAEIISNE